MTKSNYLMINTNRAKKGAIYGKWSYRDKIGYWINVHRLSAGFMSNFHRIQLDREEIEGITMNIDTQRKLHGITIIAMMIIIMLMGILFFVNLSRADDGLWRISKESYVVTTIPELRFVVVSNSKDWDTVVRANFPTRTGEEIMGMAILDIKDRKKRYTIIVPMFDDKYDSFAEMELVFGHELMHILDYVLKKDLFDPDRRERVLPR
jgi:hypothetical protein